MKHVNSSLKGNIAQVLKDVPADKTLYFECEIGDWLCSVTKDTSIDKAMTKMPEFFFNAFVSVNLVGSTVIPLFNRVEQAAWIAAQEEYSAVKGEALQNDYRRR